MVGSSPRVRGKRASLARIPAPIRLIPACTGKTNPTDNRNRASRAHPRVCGENFFGPGIWPMPVGSSPRMRGKQSKRPCMIQTVGLIPAHAGKTSWFRSRQAHRPAHPRACGENRSRRGGRGCSRGSSPRMRGKLAGRGRIRRPGRLIPAHAGKTSRPKDH